MRRNTASLPEIRELRPEAIVLSPGPGNPTVPRDFGVCRDILLEFSPEIPTLGVCLGHQGIGAIFGGRIVQARQLVHGKASQIHHDGQGVFQGLPNPLWAGRYHSLVVARDSVPKVLQVSAETFDGEVMGLRHRTHPIEGVQFHPESVLTPDGKDLLRNFLAEVQR